MERGKVISYLTLIVPIFNESPNWSEEYWKSALKIPGINWIFVDDGSTDHSLELFQKLLGTGQNKIIRHVKNLGKAEAIRTGMNHYFQEVMPEINDTDVNSHFIGYLDADGAFSQSEIERYRKLANGDQENPFTRGYEAIWSSRVKLSGHAIERKRHRHYIGRIITTLISLGDSRLPYDSQSGFKIFKVSAPLIEAFQSRFRTRWFVDLELASRISLIQGSEIRIWEEPLLEWKDINHSSLGIKSIPRVLKEIFIITIELRRARPQTNR